MTIKEILERTAQHFRQKGFASPRLDAEILFGHALKMKRVELYLHFDKPLSEEELEGCREVVRRRSKGEPVAYIVGARDFYKSTFFVGPGVLIPRPETELLVEAAVEWIKSQYPTEGFRILDLGAGTGCISLSLAKEFPQAKVIAVENSKAASAYFLKNKEALQLENVTLVQEDVEQLSGPMFEPESFDLIVANPPYISPEDTKLEPYVRQYEPSEALFALDEGFAKIRSWSAIATRLAKAPAAIFVEIGAYQGERSKALFELGRFKSKILKDYSNHDRILCTLKT